MDVRIRAATVLLTLVVALGAARAQASSDGVHDVVPLTDPARAMPSPSFFPSELALRPPRLDFRPIHFGAASHPLRLSLDLGVSYLRLAVHGDFQPGLSTFLGTSTASMAGFRLRF